MQIYPMPYCPDRTFSKELNDMEINTRIPGILAHGANLNHGSGPVFLDTISGMFAVPYGGHLT
jgi:hypothetical protein